MTSAAVPKRRPRVLIIEDDAALRDMLARALGERGFGVDVAATAAAGAATARMYAPEYAIVDLRLPDGWGLDLVSALIARNRDTRIVVLTGYGSIATAVEAVKRGATEYLVKPVTLDDVLAAFDRHSVQTRVPLEAKPMSVGRLEWEHIERVLLQCNGNVSAAARALSMHRRTLQRKLARRAARG